MRPISRLADRTFHNRHFRASGLNLVIAAIIYWNTLYRCSISVQATSARRTTCSRSSRRSAGRTSASPAIQAKLKHLPETVAHATLALQTLDFLWQQCIVLDHGTVGRRGCRTVEGARHRSAVFGASVRSRDFVADTPASRRPDPERGWYRAVDTIGATISAAMKRDEAQNMSCHLAEISDEE
jgi:hypothetical protein